MLGQLFSQSPLAGAINYAFNHWDGLTLFLSDGRVEVDTNTVERSMRPIAMGAATHCSAAARVAPRSWASGIAGQHGKLHELDPQAYLADVLERIVSDQTKSHQLHELHGPGNWKAARERSAQAAHEPAPPSGIVSAGRHAARRARAMAAGAHRAASCRHQHCNAGRLRCRNRRRTGVDQPARLESARCSPSTPTHSTWWHAGIRGDLRRRASATTTSATPSRKIRIGSSRSISASRMATSMRVPGVLDSMPPYSRDYRLGRHCSTPATLTTACCCPSSYTVWTTRGIRCSDPTRKGPETRNFCATPTPISQLSSRPCANIGCRSATHALADYCLRGCSCRLRSFRPA